MHTRTHTHSHTHARAQAFLDAAPFLRNRLCTVRAVEDPFLTEVTVDGIPIDAASTSDLRRGGVK